MLILGFEQKIFWNWAKHSTYLVILLSLTLLLSFGGDFFPPIFYVIRLTFDTFRNSSEVSGGFSHLVSSRSWYTFHTTAQKIQACSKAHGPKYRDWHLRHSVAPDGESVWPGWFMRATTALEVKDTAMSFYFFVNFCWGLTNVCINSLGLYLHKKRRGGRQFRGWSWINSHWKCNVWSGCSIPRSHRRSSSQLLRKSDSHFFAMFELGTCSTNDTDAHQWETVQLSN